jgi:protein gp37
MKNSLIEWCHHTVNFWWGCAKVSAACANCYAENIARAYSRGRATWGPSGARWIRIEPALNELFGYHKSAQHRGVRERVFINSMSDIFEDRADLDEARAALFDAAPYLDCLDLLLLTKRPENIRRMVPLAWLETWPSNVWVGTTVEDQRQADIRITHLRGVPANVRYLSVEPMLDSIQLPGLGLNRLPEVLGGWQKIAPGISAEFGIHWVIVGGESGHGARPVHPEYVRSMRDQCQAAGVPFFFKQWGEFHPEPDSLGLQPTAIAKLPSVTLGSSDCVVPKVRVYRVGKKVSGRLLDGLEWSQFPCTSHQGKFADDVRRSSLLATATATPK